MLDFVSSILDLKYMDNQISPLPANQTSTIEYHLQPLPYHTHNGIDSPLISSLTPNLSGYMQTVTYDPASIVQQVAGTTATQTLSNKTLTKPIINGSQQNVIALSGTTPTIDCTSCNIFTLTLSGNTTYSISNVTLGQVFIVEVQQGSGTSYANTWFTAVTWLTVGGLAPVQTAVSSGYTTYGFRCTGTNTYLGYILGTN